MNGPDYIAAFVALLKMGAAAAVAYAEALRRARKDIKGVSIRERTNEEKAVEWRGKMEREAVEWRLKMERAMLAYCPSDKREQVANFLNSGEGAEK